MTIGLANVRLQLNVQESVSAALRTGNLETKVNKLFQLVDGSGSGQVNKQYADSVSVSQSTNTDIDLSGSLSQAFGAVVFTAVKALLIVAGDSNPGNLTVFGGTNPFLGPLSGTTPAVVLAAGQALLFTKTDATGWAVTNATNDTLRVASAATSGTYTYDIVVLGIG
jgi:hypothetical protein